METRCTRGLSAVQRCPPEPAGPAAATPATSSPAAATARTEEAKRARPSVAEVGKAVAGGTNPLHAPTPSQSPLSNTSPQPGESSCHVGRVSWSWVPGTCGSCGASSSRCSYGFTGPQWLPASPEARLHYRLLWGFYASSLPSSCAAMREALRQGSFCALRAEAALLSLLSRGLGFNHLSLSAKRLADACDWQDTGRLYSARGHAGAVLCPRGQPRVQEETDVQRTLSSAPCCAGGVCGCGKVSAATPAAAPTAAAIAGTAAAGEARSYGGLRCARSSGCVEASHQQQQQKEQLQGHSEERSCQQHDGRQQQSVWERLAAFHVETSPPNVSTSGHPVYEALADCLLDLHAAQTKLAVLFQDALADSLAVSAAAVAEAQMAPAAAAREPHVPPKVRLQQDAQASAAAAAGWTSTASAAVSAPASTVPAATSLGAAAPSRVQRLLAACGTKAAAAAAPLLQWCPSRVLCRLLWGLQLCVRERAAASAGASTAAAAGKSCSQKSSCLRLSLVPEWLWSPVAAGEAFLFKNVDSLNLSMLLQQLAEAVREGAQNRWGTSGHAVRRLLISVGTVLKDLRLQLDQLLQGLMLLWQLPGISSCLESFFAFIKGPLRSSSRTRSPRSWPSPGGLKRGPSTSTCYWSPSEGPLPPSAECEDVPRLCLPPALLPETVQHQGQLQLQGHLQQSGQQQQEQGQGHQQLHAWQQEQGPSPSSSFDSPCSTPDLLPPAGMIRFTCQPGVFAPSGAPLAIPQGLRRNASCRSFSNAAVAARAAAAGAAAAAATASWGTAGAGYHPFLNRKPQQRHVSFSAGTEGGSGISAVRRNASIAAGPTISGYQALGGLPPRVPDLGAGTPAEAVDGRKAVAPAVAPTEGTLGAPLRERYTTMKPECM